MTLAIVTKIVFPASNGRPEIMIRKVNSVKIESTWETLTDKATIILPRNVKDFDKMKVREIFRKGDPVIIYLGYNEVFVEEFNGFITAVSADIPVKIECEDMMYLLKKHPVSISMRNTSLQDLIKAIVPAGIETDVADINIGTKRWPRTTAAQILEELQEAKIYSYFRGKTLVVGKIYSDDKEPPVIFDFSKNVVDNQLNYKHKDDVMIKIIATSNLPKGKKLKVEVGDHFGTEMNLSYYNITVEAELTKLAKLDYDKYKVDGFEGHIVVFGIPSVRHGMKGLIKSVQYPDRNGTYWIKKVDKEVSDNATYRQNVHLDKKSA